MKQFYPTLRLLMLMILTACVITDSYSQNCSNLTVTYSASESRCIATGTLQITASGGSGTFNYKVTGPTSTSFTSSSTITGLLPGTYTLTVRDIVANCNLDVNNVVITGSYADPRFALTSTDVSCNNGNDGTISVSSLQFGRSPFTYTIVAPSPASIGTTNSTGNFTGLVPGTYSIQLRDSCGGMQTRTISIQNYNWSITSSAVTLNSCTMFNAVIGLTDSKGNTNASGSAFNGFQYGVVNSVGDTTWHSSRSFSFDLLQKRSIRFVVKDRCGLIQSTVWNNTAVPAVFANATVNGLTCSGFNAAITGQQNLTNPTYSLVDNLGNPVPGQPNNSTGVFTNIPYGSYCIRVTNTCYDTVITRCFSQAQAVPSIGGSVTVNTYTCTTVRATLTGTNLTNPSFCLFNDLGVQVGACNSTGIFNNVPYGTYSIQVTDGCTGAVFTRNFTANKRTRSVANTVTVNGYTCTTANATITGQTNLTGPVLYCLVDNLGNPVPGFPCNNTGVFTNVPYGQYCNNITDGCADTTIQRCVNITRPASTLGASVISARTCSGFTATVGGVANLYAGGVYCLLDNLGNPVVGVPCNTTGVFTNIPYGTYCIRQTDNCSGSVLTNCFTVTAPTPSVGAASITNQTCSGFRATITSQQNLTNPSFCLFDNLNNQIGACNNTGIFDVTGFGTYRITTTDGCTGAVFNTNFTVTKPVPSVGTVNISNQACGTFTADVIGETNLTNPQYYLRNSGGTIIANNATGTFNNVAYGAYCIDITNSCLDTTIQRCFNVAPNAITTTVTATPSCALTTADIAVQINSGFGPYTINVYDDLNNLVRTTNTASTNVTLSALPTLVIGQTFRVVVSSACGAPATQFVTAQRSVFNRTPTVIARCPSGTWPMGSSDLQVVATTNLTSVNMSITQKNFAATTINYSSKAGNTFMFTNLEPATYVVTYTFGGCVQTVNDTVVVGPYQYPNLSQSAAYQCDNNSFSVGASVNGGVSPFGYEVIGSSPSSPSIISGTQANPVFTISNGVQYSLVRLRATDACGNATLNDVSILPLANVVVRASSQCWYNDITLTTDTVPNATYTWYKKTSATDSVLIGSSVAYNIPYLLPGDTGVYVSRMSVNSGCLTKISYFNLVPNCGILLPVKASLSGKSVNEAANELTWTAKDEQSAKKYIIERSNSQNGQFEVIGSVSSNQALSSNYSFTDKNPLKEGNVYRLKIELVSGKASYSNLISIRSAGESTITAYPNPVKDLLNINIRGTQSQNYRLSIFNNAGQLIHNTTKLNIQNGTIQYRRDVKAKPGLYFIHVTNMTTGDNNTYKIIFE